VKYQSDGLSVQFPAAGNLAANFLCEGSNFANSAQNLQISVGAQGMGQGFQGISF
jgi:hypothetical protein